MLNPLKLWNIDTDYIEFQVFDNKNAATNDADERSVKAVHAGTIMSAHIDIKLQKMLLVKSKLQKARSWTKAAVKEGADQLIPEEQVQAACEVDYLATVELEVSG